MNLVNFAATSAGLGRGRQFCHRERINFNSSLNIVVQQLSGACSKLRTHNVSRVQFV